MEKRDKQRAEKLIDLYVGYLQSVTHDAGWHGDSLIARWADYEGCPPAPSGNDVSNLQSIREIQYLRGTHVLVPMVLRVMRDLREKDQEAYKACIFDRAYRGRVVMIGDRPVRQTTARVSEALGMTQKEYLAAAERGRRKLIALENKHLDRELRAINPDRKEKAHA